jgi:hypothetical protein
MDRYALVKNIVENIKDGVFVEIGTHTGEFADFILENSVNSTLYCIDPYLSYNDYDDAINFITGDQLFNDTYSKLYSKYGERIKFIRKFSSDAVGDIPSAIDFLYVDGNHRYSYVLNDLSLFYPLVKPTCYIIGDDAVDTDDTKRNENGDVLINWSSYSYGHYGVIKAFRDFCDSNNIVGELIGNQYKIQKV